jgi:hypothetical protein
MARLITTLATALALALTVVLPIYPEGITPEIAAFLGLCGIAALFGLADRKARYELAIMAPWGAAIVLAILVGSVHNGESQQAIEDALPYALFVIGLVAGRGIGSPRLVLRVALWACVVDSVVSLYLMESFAPGMRSTYTYYKITAGLPLVGLYLASVLRETAEPAARRKSWAWLVHLAIVVVMIAGIVFSVTRGMLLGWILGAVVTSYVRKPSQALMGLCVALLALLAYSSTFAEFGTEYLRFGQETTIEGRFREVEEAWEGFVDAPMFGQGLGATIEVDGFRKAFVHNMAAYQLWKFGLVGNALLVVPLFAVLRELRHTRRRLRAFALGGSISLLAYLVTCAAYKTYYLVWMLGAVVGTSLTFFELVRERERAAAARANPAVVAPPP